MEDIRGTMAKLRLMTSLVTALSSMAIKVKVDDIRANMKINADIEKLEGKVSHAEVILKRLKSDYIKRVDIVDLSPNRIKQLRKNLVSLAEKEITPIINIKDNATKVIDNIKSIQGKIENVKNTLKPVFDKTIGANIKSSQQTARINGAFGGDVGKTEKMKEFIQSTQKKSPLNPDDISDAATYAALIEDGDLIKAQNLLKIAQDMAALNPGKSVSEAVLALGSAKTGDYKKLTDFGLPISTTKEKSGNIQFAEILSQAEVKFKGGAEKLANTAAGSIAIIANSIDSSLEKIGEDAFKKLEPKLIALAKWFTDNQPLIEGWVEAGGKALSSMISIFAKVGNNGADAFNKLKDTLSNCLDYYDKHEKAIKGIAGVMAFFLLPAIINSAINYAILTKTILFNTAVSTAETLVLKAMYMWDTLVAAAQWAFNAAVWANPIVWLVVLIIGLIAAIVSLITHWDKVKEVMLNVWNTVVSAFSSIQTAFQQYVINPIVSSMPDWLKKFFGMGGNVDVNVNEKSKPKQHSTGLSYVPFDGYMAELHKGERVLTASENRAYSNPPRNYSKNVSAGGNVFNIAINGVNKSTDEILNDLVYKISEAVNTMGEVAFE